MSFESLGRPRAVWHCGAAVGVVEGGNVVDTGTVTDGETPPNDTPSDFPVNKFNSL